MPPKVSVIIPNYNHARYLPQRIESVLNQSFRDIEVILMDDCSPDESRGIIEDYAARDARIRVVYNEQNSGSTFKQWNKGIGLVKGEYVWIAESDDFCEPDLLASLLPFLEADPAVVLAYCDSFDIDENNIIKATWERFLTELDPMWKHDFVTDGITLVRRFMSYRNIIPNASAVLARTSTLRETGPADETYRVVGDWLFWARLISKGKVAYSAKTMNHFRSHQNNARSKNHVSGSSLEETTRMLVAMRVYGEPDPIYYRKAINLLLELWYHAVMYHSVPWSRHRAIFRNIAVIEPGLPGKMIRMASHRFFHNFTGFRILLGDRFLHRLKRKR